MEPRSDLQIPSSRSGPSSLLPLGSPPPSSPQSPPGFFGDFVKEAGGPMSSEEGFAYALIATFSPKGEVDNSYPCPSPLPPPHLGGAKELRAFHHGNLGDVYGAAVGWEGEVDMGCFLNLFATSSKPAKVMLVGKHKARRWTLIRHLLARISGGALGCSLKALAAEAASLRTSNDDALERHAKFTEDALGAFENFKVLLEKARQHQGPAVSSSDQFLNCEDLGEALHCHLQMAGPFTLHLQPGKHLELVSTVLSHVKSGGLVLRINYSSLMPSLHLAGGKGEDIMSRLGHVLSREGDERKGFDYHGRVSRCRGQQVQGGIRKMDGDGQGYWP